jgi:pyridinium-3,5-biscarboxylic acid mononucleotide sulfurtransferase
MLLKALQRVKEAGLHGSSGGKNLIAFSGGVDSSVVAKLVFMTYPENSTAVLGISHSLSKRQNDLAKKVAKSIGISLVEVPTAEGNDDEYVRNQGNSCFVCKTHLYKTLQGVVNYAASEATSVVLFNGTNKDDLSDTSRVGLIAAKNFLVQSPLDTFEKSQVRELALELGLPNHNYAASPCLRSRLVNGVAATSENLQRIEVAEDIVREAINNLTVADNFRVRHLSNGGARVELDEQVLLSEVDLFPQIAAKLSGLGYSNVVFSKFKSGSAVTIVSRSSPPS